ncbi:MAG: BON domain-containing protein [Vicinamibacterales bacterium]
MLGSLVRAVVLIVVLVGAGAFLLGWWGSGRIRDDVRQTVGTTGVDTQKAREVGAKVGETTATAADQARRAINDGAVTAKIKAKMALDDTVKALDIDVDTVGTTVTLSGVVATDAQRQKALQLARETDGVKQVVDQLRVQR